MHPDHAGYLAFTGPARLDKAVNSLLGIAEGIAADGRVVESEVTFMRTWLAENAEFRDRHPFNELVPVVETALADGIIAEEERQDVIWLCNRLRSSEYYDARTADIQRLHALVGALVADGVVTEAELRALSAWLSDHEHLKTCWPYDEIDSVVTGVLSDGVVSEGEQKLLRDFFSEFVSVMDSRTIANPPVSDGREIGGLCAVCPEIVFADSSFCFTGASCRYTRSQLGELVTKLGGRFVNSVSRSLNYLIIGAEGNPCWSYACYGRKVETAVELRKQGFRITLVHEYDFHDAVADCA